jgi:hypothetical protein
MNTNGEEIKYKDLKNNIYKTKEHTGNKEYK